MSKIGLFYAPEKGSVEKVAKLIAEKIGHDKIDLISVQTNIDKKADKIKEYDKLIFGISTVGRDSWDANYSKIGWDLLIPDMKNLDFSGKTVAIFGLGNQIMYPDNFVDSMGVLAKLLLENNANVIGYFPTEEYDFNDSGAIVDDKFFGVAVDEDNESDQTDDRIERWLDSIKNEFQI